jgi:hypothetical protein
MIEGISAVTLGIHEMPRAFRFYRTLGFEVLHGSEDSSFASFRAGTSYLNLIAQPAERRWSWWGRVLLTLDTNHCRTSADHTEFPRGSTAQIYNATAAIRPAIYYAHYNRLAVKMISNQHHRTKWQCLVRCSKPVWASDLTTCGTAAAVECGAAGLG